MPAPDRIHEPTPTTWRCPVCGGVDGDAVGGTPYRRCRSCGHHDGASAVRSGQVLNHALEHPGGPSLVERSQRRALERAGWSGGPVVDIGCGHGGFLRTLPADTERYGVEVTEESVEAARRWFGVRVETALTDVPDGASVTFWHSAEHIPVGDLRGMLERIAREGGERVVVSVPNAASLQWRLLGPRWTYYDVQAHLSQFTPDSMDLLMRQAGYRRTATITMPPYELFGALQSLVNVVRPHNRLYEALKRGQGRQERRALLGDAAVAAVMALPAAALTLVGMSRRRWRSCLNAAYVPI